MPPSNSDVRQVLDNLREKFGKVDDLEQAVLQVEEQSKDLWGRFSNLEKTVRQATYGNDGRYKGVFDSEGQAAQFGLTVLALTGDEKTRAYAGEMLKREFPDALERALSSDPDSAGGVFGVPEFSNRLLSLFENYGVVARKSFRMPDMGSQISYPKEVGRPSVYLINEAEIPTQDESSFVQVTLTPREMGALTYYPRKLERISERVGVMIGEMVARGLAWAFAFNLDRCGFNGTGSVADLRITGITQKLLGLSDTISEIAGLNVGTGNAWSELTLNDHAATMGLLPEYALADAEWYCSLSYFFNVMVPLMLSQGGATAGEVEGRRRLLFLGYPVQITQVMPATEANSQISALFGNMSQAVDYGVGDDFRIETSRDYKFAERQVAVLGVADCDLQVHNVGNASATASEKQPGAMVGLITAAS